MDINTLLSLLGKHLGIPDLQLINGVCCLEFNDGNELFIEPGSTNKYLHLYSVLGKIPQSNNNAFNEQIFERNIFGKHTGSANICCDKDRQEVLLQESIQIQVQPVEQLIESVEAFAQQTLDHKIWLSEFEMLGKPDKRTSEIDDQYLRV